MINNPIQDRVYNIEIAERLWDLKESNDLTVFGLSKRLHINPEHVECWLMGEEIPEEKELIYLALAA